MFKELFSGTDDDRGVSPVIGVILMVAITVILAAVIGAFVLGLGDQVSTQAPQASIGFSFDGNNVTLAHEGGDNLDKSTIEVTMGGKLLYDDSGLNSTNTDDTAPDTDTWSDTISTGDELTIPVNATPTNGETIRVVWSNPSGGSSNTLAERQWPN
jgi:archaeal flagellin N-terminal-like domain